MKKIEATFNAIICTEVTEEEENYDGIIVPDTDRNNTSILAKIVSVGPGHTSITGTFVPTKLKEGMLVVLPTTGPTKFELDRQTYLISKENEVLAIIKEEE
jgi:co-chaperonin GroES (HSP10)